MGEGAAPDSYADLLSAIRAELAALDAEDAPAIETATAVKVAALAVVQNEIAAGVAPQRAMLELARDLNAEAMLRARAKLLAVERRLSAVSAVVAAGGGRPALVYGRDGRWA